MTARSLPRLPGCGAPATVRVEVFEPGTDVRVTPAAAVAYGCDTHIGAIEAMLTDAELRVSRSSYPLAARTWPCGRLFSFSARIGQEPSAAEVAAELAKLRLPEPTGPEFRYVGDQPADFRYSPSSGHPSWCAQKPDEDGHATGYIEIAQRDSSLMVEVELWGTFDNTTNRWVLAVSLRLTEDYKVRTYVIGLDQAEAFAAVVHALVELGRGDH